MADKPEYKVEKKEELRNLINGEVVTFYRVWATSKSGTYFHVDISESNLSKANVILSARAKELDAIQ